MAGKMSKRRLIPRSLSGKSFGFHAPQKAKTPKQVMPKRGEKS